jgi:hypothetical protein
MNVSHIFGRELIFLSPFLFECYFTNIKIDDKIVDESINFWFEFDLTLRRDGI